MGAAVAKELFKRIDQKDILICDIDGKSLDKARHLGYKCYAEMVTLISEVDIIIAAASTQILGPTEVNQMRNGACVVCVTSGDDQFKPDYLEGLNKAGETLYLTTYQRPSGDIIHLACDGRSVNFSIGSTAHPVLHAVLASVCVSAFSCLTTAITSSRITQLSESEVLVIKEIYEKKFGPIDPHKALIIRLKAQAEREVSEDSTMVQGLALFTPMRATNVDFSIVKNYEEFTYDLDDAIARFLFTDPNKVLLLQANAGSSKSLFGRKLEKLLWSCYQSDDPIPLFIVLPQIRYLDRDLIVQALENKGFSAKEIELSRTNEFLPILDRFDEINGKPNLIKELSKICDKIIVTSRLGYLTDNDDFLFKENECEDITKVYIMPFDEARIQAYIERYAGNPSYNISEWKVEQYKEFLNKFPELKDLIKEPLILQLTLSALPQLERCPRITIYQVFTADYTSRQIDKLKLSMGEILKDYTSYDGTRVISAGRDNSIRIWNIERDEPTIQQTLFEHTDHVTSIALADDGCILISGSKDQTIQIWNRANTASDFSHSQTLDGGYHTYDIKSVALSQDKRTIISGAKDNTICVWCIENGSVFTLRGHTDWVLTVAMTQDGNAIISGGVDNTLKYWQKKSGQWLLTGQIAAVESALISAGANLKGIKGLSCTNKKLIMERGYTGVLGLWVKYQNIIMRKILQTVLIERRALDPFDFGQAICVSDPTASGQPLLKTAIDNILDKLKQRVQARLIDLHSAIKIWQQLKNSRVFISYVPPQSYVDQIQEPINRCETAELIKRFKEAPKVSVVLKDIRTGLLLGVYGIKQNNNLRIIHINLPIPAPILLRALFMLVYKKNPELKRIYANDLPSNWIPMLQEFQSKIICSNDEGTFNAVFNLDEIAKKIDSYNEFKIISEVQLEEEYLSHFIQARNELKTAGHQPFAVFIKKDGIILGGITCLIIKRILFIELL